VSFCDSWASCSTYTVRWLIIHIWTLLRICLLCMYEWQYASIYVSLCATYVDKESLFFFPFMPPPDQSGRRRHYVLRLSVRRSVHLSVRPSVHLFVRSSAIKLWTRMNRFWCQLAKMFHEATAWNDHVWGSWGKRSRSYDADETCRPSGGGGCIILGPHWVE